MTQINKKIKRTQMVRKNSTLTHKKCALVAQLRLCYVSDAHLCSRKRIIGRLMINKSHLMFNKLLYFHRHGYWDIRQLYSKWTGLNGTWKVDYYMGHFSVKYHRMKIRSLYWMGCSFQNPWKTKLIGIFMKYCWVLLHQSH